MAVPSRNSPPTPCLPVGWRPRDGSELLYWMRRGDPVADGVFLAALASTGSVRELAESLGIHVRTAWRWLATPRISRVARRRQLSPQARLERLRAAARTRRRPLELSRPLEASPVRESATLEHSPRRHSLVTMTQADYLHAYTQDHPVQLCRPMRIPSRR